MWRLAVRALAGRAQSRASLCVLRAETPLAWSAPQLPLVQRDACAAVREYAKGGKGGGKGGGKSRREEDDDEPPPARAAPASAAPQFDVRRIKSKFDAALDALRRELGKLRTGRASPGLLEHISVAAYGTPTPLGQLGAIIARDASTLVVNLYDTSLAPAVEAAVATSALGLSARVEGDQVVVPIPAPTAEGLAKVAKLAAAAGEQAKVSGRRVRAEAMDELKRAEAGTSKDETRRREKDLQSAVDAFTKEVTAEIAAKEKELKSA